jgi:hypothetical protein
VSAWTYDEEEVLQAWPKLCALVWSQLDQWGPAGMKRGVTELAGYLPDALRFSELPADVKKALRPTLFSAKIPRFDFKEGEVFEAELWLLNDAPTPVSGKVRVEARVGDTVISLLDWSAATEPCMNMRGPTVRFVLPHAESDRVILTLSADGELSSEYVFRYYPKKPKNTVTRQLNV